MMKFPLELVVIILNCVPQVYMFGKIPLVCKLWKSLSEHILDGSLELTRREHIVQIITDGTWSRFSNLKFNELALGAAEVGNLECLKWSHEKGCTLNKSMIRYASSGGHLECVKYLHMNGCELDESILCLATQGGHLNCIVYLHKNGCPWHPYVMRIAAQEKHIDCFNYLCENYPGSGYMQGVTKSAQKGTLGQLFLD